MVLAFHSRPRLKASAFPYLSTIELPSDFIESVVRYEARLLELRHITGFQPQRCLLIAHKPSRDAK